MFRRVEVPLALGLLPLALFPGGAVTQFCDVILVIARSELGTVQGGSISPLLANIYLHYAFGLWVEQWHLREMLSVAA